MLAIRVIIAVIVAVVLSSCSMGGSPNRDLVKQAIAIQVSQTQQALTQQLYSSSSQPPEFEIGRVHITKRQPLTIQDLQSYQVQGTYDLTLKFSNRRVTQRENPFEVYLQRQIEGKTWRVAQLQPGDEEKGDRWVTQLIPTD
ncbi:MAG: hypothetical protein HC879_00220 [Leptolyngbyaceae cyanobacterium SL_5_9]|nr:hypothetical protein [Leptolyngbyaceae cyanobacterium SL_5_9]NJO76718.1 hypothetical protein [Leptolyngbyaceae cyanobacterium RM1_406_9]